MAIRKDITWRGVLIKNAYIRIDHVRGGKRENRIVPTDEGQSIWQGQVSVYADKNEPVPIFVTDVSIPFADNQAPYPSMYAAMKASPEFLGAADDI